MSRCLLVLALWCWPLMAQPAAPVVIGSKNFTESVILGEVLRLQAASRGIPVEHRRALGGTAILWQGLLNGRIDAYPEYTGTLTHELLRDLPGSADVQAITTRLAALGIGMGPPLGFDDGYALALSAEGAKRLHLQRLSDLSQHSGLRFGLSNEFLNRADGWPRLRQTFAPPAAQVRGLDHDLAYRALVAGEVDVIDCYTTDAEIAFYHLQPLTDDRGFFPRYEARILYRLDMAHREPHWPQVLDDLANRISAASMRSLNARVKLQGEGETQVAASFLHLQVPPADDWLRRLQQRTIEHLALVGLSMALAIALGIPMGIVAAHWAAAKQPVLAVTSVLQTVPSLAMLVFLIPWLGIGAKPAIAALFFYSLLPIVRNTIAGLDGIEEELRQAARAMGLPARVILLRVELPLALPTIIAGISTAAVINVGTATLGALIGAGGYGQPILTGVRLDNTALILEGAVPAALLALLAQAAFQLLGHLLTPRGLRRPAAPQPTSA